MNEGNGFFTTNFNGDIVHPRWDVESIGFFYNDSEQQDNFYDTELTEVLKSIYSLMQNRMKLYELFFIKTPERFNRVDKYYGIWKRIPINHFAFHKANPEKILSTNRGELMVACTEIMYSEMKEALSICVHRFCNAILFFLNSDTIREFTENSKNLFSDKEAVDQLLIRGAIIVNVSDYDVEGRCLYVCGKENNKEIKFLESKLGLS